MSSPVAERVESLLENMEASLHQAMNEGEREDPTQLLRDEEALLAFANNDFESLFATLEMPYEDMERRILVSSMVQEAVAKGFLKALEEESANALAAKDEEICQLRDALKEKDAALSELQKAIGDKFFGPCPEESESFRKSEKLWQFVHESQKKWRESEVSFEEREKDLANLAASMADMASLLDIEYRKAALLEKQLLELREREVKQTVQISALQEEVERLNLNQSRLKRQARLKELKFGESIERAQAESQQQSLQTRRVMEEKDALEKILQARSLALSNLERHCRELEDSLSSLAEKLTISSTLEHRLNERVEEQKLIQQVEREFLMTMFEQHVLKSQADALSSEKNNASRTKLEHCDVEGGDELFHFRQLSEETSWKADAESLIFQTVVDGWHKEVSDTLQKITLELAWRDETIFYRDREVERLTQAVDELENDYATLMSICLTLIRDQNDMREEIAGHSAHEVDFGRRKLIELSELLNSREFTVGQGEKFSTVLDLEEELVSQQFQHEVELEIISEVLRQKHQDVVGLLDLDFTLSCSQGTFDCNEAGEQMKVPAGNFQELEAQLESFLELEACRLERIKSGCSTSIANCEFKLDNLMKSLSDQVNEMKTKISFVQEAIKQQEWKHIIENDILLTVLQAALGQQTERKPELLSFKEDIQIVNRKSPVSDLLDQGRGLDSPLFMQKAGIINPEIEDEYQQQTCFKALDSKTRSQDKLICIPKRDIEEMRKEKAMLEHQLDERTEELYSLKRLFWKEKEVWMSKLSQPQRKEVETLSRHSSISSELEEEFRKLEKARFDSLVSKLKGEWTAEKATLLEVISQRDREIEHMRSELAILNEKEKRSITTEAQLLARIADLEIEKDNHSCEILNQEFSLARLKQEFQTEKEHMVTELAKLVEKERVHSTTEGCLSAQVAELESAKEKLILERHDQDSLYLKCKQEWQTERDYLLEKVSEAEKAVEEANSKLTNLSETVRSYMKQIEQLENERNQLNKLKVQVQPANSLEEAEIALALAKKEREEEEKRRKILEIQLQGLKLEVKNLQGLNDEVTALRNKLESVPRQLESKLAEQINQFVKASQEMERKTINGMQEKVASLDTLKERCRLLKGHAKSFSTKESYYKHRLEKESSNLQKAEAEVDLLGDEVESLLEVLEEVHSTFEDYAPILQHHPRMTRVAKLVKQEIQLRIDPKYGI